MSATVTILPPLKGKAHFPAPLDSVINPEGWVEMAQVTYQQITDYIAQAKTLGYDNGAIVIKHSSGFKSAAPYYWGMVIGHNHQPPAEGKEYLGPVKVKWPLQHSATETVHWPDELFLVMESPDDKYKEELERELTADYQRVQLLKQGKTA